jgi:hypothetical protein
MYITGPDYNIIDQITNFKAVRKLCFFAAFFAISVLKESMKKQGTVNG